MVRGCWPNATCWSQPKTRVDRAAALTSLEVWVTAGRDPGCTRVRDNLAPSHMSRCDHKTGQVVVGRRQVDTALNAMVDDQPVTVASRQGLRRRHDDIAGGRSVNRRTTVGGEVDAGVIAQGITARTELLGHRCTERIAQESAA